MEKKFIKLIVYVARALVEDSPFSSFNLRGFEVIQLHILVLSLAFPILIVDKLRRVRRTLDGVLEKTCKGHSRSLSARLVNAALTAPSSQVRSTSTLATAQHLRTQECPLS